MGDADYGFVGKAGGKISLYRKRDEVKTGIPQERGVEELNRPHQGGRPLDGAGRLYPAGAAAEPEQPITVGIPLVVK